MSQSLPEALANFLPDLPLVVAFSGGADSTALLLACAEKWPGQVRAMHVHHGLQAAADGFQRHCEAMCARLDVPLAIRRVDARGVRGESPEDAARRARYEAFDAIPSVEWPLDAINNIALAHHADDQIETVLLRAFGGSGPAGLAGIAERRGPLVRPLLGLRRAELAGYVRDRGLPAWEDPANADQILVTLTF